MKLSVLIFRMFDSRCVAGLVWQGHRWLTEQGLETDHRWRGGPQNQTQVQRWNR